MSEPIEEFCGVLRNHGLQTNTSALSTFVQGETGALFEACNEAFKQLGKKYAVVLNMKVSNACPSE